MAEKEVKVAAPKKKAPAKKAEKKVAVKAPEKVVEVKVEKKPELRYRGLRVMSVSDLVLHVNPIKDIQLENGNRSRLPLAEFLRDVK